MVNLGDKAVHVCMLPAFCCTMCLHDGCYSYYNGQWAVPFCKSRVTKPAVCMQLQQGLALGHLVQQLLAQLALELHQAAALAAAHA